MTRFLGTRGAAAVGAFLLLLSLGSNPAQAQAVTASLAVPSSATFDLRTQALINAVARSAYANAPAELVPVTGAPAPAYSTSPAYPASPYSVTVHRDVGV